MQNNMSQLNSLTTEEENILLPKLIKVLKKTTKERTLYAPMIIEGFKKHMESWGCTGTFSQSRLRKLINHIRINGLLPIMSGVTGYYVSEDKEEIEKMADSLDERAESIQAAAKGLREYATQLSLHEKEGWDFKFDERKEDVKDDLFYNLDEFSLNLYRSR